MSLLTDLKTPTELLINIAERAVCDNMLFGERTPRHWGKPGEYYNALPDHEKEILKRLTSADARNIRVDAIIW